MKPIPSSTETMRIEFMAPEEFKRHNDIRVDIQNGVHTRELRLKPEQGQEARDNFMARYGRGLPFLGALISNEAGPCQRALLFCFFLLEPFLLLLAHTRALAQKSSVARVILCL
jgi:hypothetical protein